MGRSVVGVKPNDDVMDSRSSNLNISGKNHILIAPPIYTMHLAYLVWEFIV